VPASSRAQSCKIRDSARRPYSTPTETDGAFQLGSLYELDLRAFDLGLEILSECVLIGTTVGGRSCSTCPIRSNAWLS
jgi:hypothetical protein